MFRDDRAVGVAADDRAAALRTTGQMASSCTPHNKKNYIEHMLKIHRKSMIYHQKFIKISSKIHQKVKLFIKIH